MSKFTKCTKHFEQIAIGWLFSANVSQENTHLGLVTPILNFKVLLLIQITQQKLLMQ